MMYNKTSHTKAKDCDANKTYIRITQRKITIHEYLNQYVRTCSQFLFTLTCQFFNAKQSYKRWNCITNGTEETWSNLRVLSLQLNAEIHFTTCWLALVDRCICRWKDGFIGFTRYLSCKTIIQFSHYTSYLYSTKCSSTLLKKFILFLGNK